MSNLSDYAKGYQDGLETGIIPWFYFTENDEYARGREAGVRENNRRQHEEGLQQAQFEHDREMMEEQRSANSSSSDDYDYSDSAFSDNYYPASQSAPATGSENPGFLFYLGIAAILLVVAVGAISDNVPKGQAAKIQMTSEQDSIEYDEGFIDGLMARNRADGRNVFYGNSEPYAKKLEQYYASPEGKEAVAKRSLPNSSYSLGRAAGLKYDR